MACHVISLWQAGSNFRSTPGQPGAFICPPSSLVAVLITTSVGLSVNLRFLTPAISHAQVANLYGYICIYTICCSIQRSKYLINRATATVQEQHVDLFYSDEY